MTQLTPEVDVETWQRRVAELLPGLQAELRSLVRIPSVSQASFDRAEVERSALAVAELLTRCGLPEVEIVRAARPGADGVPGAPAVLARRPAPPGAPTVLLYAHHDVQPPGDPALWSSPPFEPTERDGRLYGRGAADDKAGVVLHATALAALADTVPLGVTVFVEGEEEIGSPTFEQLLAAHADRLAADVIVVADSANWRVGTPALTASLRGLVDGEFTLRTLDHAVHSGVYGGAVPDALTATIRLLATLWDDEGTLRVEGLDAGRVTPAGVDYPEAALRADAGVLPGVELIGSGPTAERLWNAPALTVIGMDVPPADGASNTLLPAVRVRFSLRLPPRGEPEQALAALGRHLTRHAPWGARVEVTGRESGAGWAGDVDNRVYRLARWALDQAWSRDPGAATGASAVPGSAAVTVGLGGSIPFVGLLGETFPGATVLVTGVEDPDSRAHGSDESVDLAELARAVLAEVLFLAALAAPA